ncbi:MAG TPA: sigma-70 family RNA polymerase sigma factor [Nostocaceae cyanobacterium]|nr:sigma-70 family RNA polymerase sigma factor [Nostocaceae cyanobacterium]
MSDLVSPMSEEERIRQLVIEVCQYPKGSLERQRGLNELIMLIQKSGKMWQGYGEAYREEALQETWLYFCRNLCEATTGDRYNPDKASVFTWLSSYFKYRLLDWQRKIQTDQALIESPKATSDGGEIDPLDLLEARPEPPPILQEIYTWLEKERYKLTRIHVRERPDINCLVLIEARLPPETSWQELATKYGVAIATLSNFYQRECFPRLLQFGQSQGYLDDE